MEGSVAELDLLYPDRSARDLKANRLYHKRAEKARRDRMKKALKDLAGLLPPVCAVEKSNSIPVSDTIDATEDAFSTSHYDSATSQSCTDKISIIEAAVEYIGNLQKELLEMKCRLDKEHATRVTPEKQGREYT
jgi:hypothetical protein